jgi:hypothetical protein
LPFRNGCLIEFPIRCPYAALEMLPAEGTDKLHSRKLRSIAEVAFQ